MGPMIQEVLLLKGLTAKRGPTMLSTTHSLQSHAMDEAAFEEFYQETARPLWSYIYRVSGNAALSDDLLQDAYCRFLRASLTGMDPSQMKSYLYKIATNLIRDHWRQIKREGGLSLNQVAADEAVAKSDDASGLGLDLTRVFQQLKPQEQSLLWLAYVEGNEHREIARALDLKEKSVRVLLFRARKRLAGLLKPREEKGKASNGV
jgi:RNA polymerase sigma-70 factor (ECF subfamily)